MSSKYVFLQGPTEIAEGQRSIGRAVKKRILQILWNTSRNFDHTNKIGTHQKLEHTNKL